MPLRLLLLSTPVGPLGCGQGGGVELTVVNLAQVLVSRGHRVAVAAPAGSVLPKLLRDLPPDSLKLVQIPGTWQPTAQHQAPTAQAVTGSALANAWEYARQAQGQYDLLVNFAYDWLPFYLTSFFSVPVAHFLSMGSLRAGESSPSQDLLERAIAQTSLRFPGTLGAYSQSQANTFSSLPVDQWQILGGGLDIANYDYCGCPGKALAWVGRISPEKGLEDAVAAAARAGQPLKIFGTVEDTDYWRSIQQQIEQADMPIDYCGFLPTSQLQQALGKCRALLMTPRWVEAFGLVAIEALACGVPVIAYRRGGPAEIVRSGKTGWLVAPNDVSELIQAIARIDQISRTDCRQQAETLYSLPVWGTRFEQWFYRIVSSTISS